MKIETLISTMNKKDNYEILDLIHRMNVKTNVVVVNQNCKMDNIEYIDEDDKKVKIINSHEKGLSKSRNQLLYNANADIGIIADDDLTYLSEYQKKIKESFEKNPAADIICFKVYKGDKPFKKYSSIKENINFLSALSKSSVEIAFRIKSIVNNNIKFDENFGSGAKEYISGEENIFLSDCLKMGLKIIYEPVFIARLNIGDSSWFKGFNKQYFLTKGAVYERINAKLSTVFILLFAIKKYKVYKDKMTILDAVKYMNEGKKEYREMRIKNK